jgi:hypothetical protein
MMTAATMTIVRGSPLMLVVLLTMVPITAQAIPDNPAAMEPHA